MASRGAASRFRLSPHVRPTRYEVALEPSLARGTFRGRVAIDVRLARATSRIVLHAADLDVESARIETAAGRAAATVTPTPVDETVALDFERPAPAGDARIVLAFAGPLSRHLRGFYAAEAGGQPYAFTQCEAAEARRIFPCFDEPSFKARFAVRVTVDAGHAAIGNAPVAHEERRGRKRVVTFAETPLLSTYLFALAVGPLEASRVRRCGATPVRVWHVPGKGRLAAFGLEAAARSLARLERYFGLPYPYGKLDLVAVPDFEAGAMENAGAVFFRETLLLTDPRTVSIAERKRVAEVIAHELAHMWYGNLVTMAWWDDLWLNEAFATWMAYRVVADWHPEWRMWETFEHDRAAALALDALTNTHPIYAPVRSVAEATENFDVITYEKGAAVVRMIEHYLGASTFRAGVRRYMRRHREGNATAADLWRALEEASGLDVGRVAQSWIAQPGFPLVTLARTRGGRRVRQARFFADPRVGAGPRRRRWPVPLVVKVEGGGVVRTLADRASQTVRAPARTRWCQGNAKAGGFYRVRHDAADLARMLEAPRRSLAPVERLALVGDQWALVRAGVLDAGAFLDVVEALRGETDHDVLGGMAGPLATIDDQVLEPGGPEQTALRAWVARRFEPAFRRAGWKPRKSESDQARLRRAALLGLVGGVAELPAVLDEARGQVERYLDDRRALDANLADAVANLAATGGDAALYERYRAAVEAASTPQDRRRFLLALPSFRDRALIERTLGDTLTDAIPTQDVAFVLMRLFGNPAGRERAWTFLTAKWSTLRERMPPLMMARLVEATPALREPRYATSVRRFFRRHPLPEASRAIKQALEVFRLNAALRRRTAPQVARWLRRHGR
jgi:puromycin-sensitive aminopeptidase